MKVLKWNGDYIAECDSIAKAKAIARENNLAGFKIQFDDGTRKRMQKGSFARIPMPNQRGNYNGADHDLYADALDCFDKQDLHNLLDKTDLRGHSQSYWDKLNRIASAFDYEEATQ